MKKIVLLYLVALGVSITSCNNNTSNSTDNVENIKYHELFEITDEFVKTLHSSVRNYGVFYDEDYAKYTKDKEYKVFPLGRLINVKIERFAEDEEYENLQKVLESHYSNDSRVNSVYRCNGGTIMIDCRN